MRPLRAREPDFWPTFSFGAIHWDNAIVELSARVANYLTQASFESLGAELERSLQLVGLELELSLASLVSKRDDASLRTLYQFRAIGYMDPAFEMDLRHARWFADQLDEGEDIIVDDVADLPGAADFESQTLTARQTAALALVRAGAETSAFLVVEMRSTPRKWSSKELGTLHDVAFHLGAALNRHQQQLELVTTARQAGRDAREKSQFIATLAHELRTPLTAIIGYGQLLSSASVGTLNEKQERFVGDIVSCAEHLERIVNESLDLAKIDAGRMSLNLEEHDARSHVEQAVLSVRAKAEAADLELRVEMPDAPVQLMADPLKIRQVLINLLTNAIKFTSVGSVTVSVEERGPDVVLTVTDTGDGISPGNIDRIFESFARVYKSRSSDEGTGLGLALVKRLVELHCGTISVASNLGSGSAFTVSLPKRAKAALTGRPAFVRES